MTDKTKIYGILILLAIFILVLFNHRDCDDKANYGYKKEKRRDHKGANNEIDYSRFIPPADDYRLPDSLPEGTSAPKTLPQTN